MFFPTVSSDVFLVNVYVYGVRTCFSIAEMMNILSIHSNRFAGYFVWALSSHRSWRCAFLGRLAWHGRDALSTQSFHRARSRLAPHAPLRGGRGGEAREESRSGNVRSKLKKGKEICKSEMAFQERKFFFLIMEKLSWFFFCFDFKMVLFFRSF